MTMPQGDVEELVAGLRALDTDHQHVEAKASSWKLPSGLWKSMSAFANTPGGGVIILGVDESNGFAINGVVDPKRVQADLSALDDEMAPALRPSIEFHEIEGHTVIVAEIAELPTNQKPCYRKREGPIGGSYIRVGDSNRLLSTHEVESMLRSHGQPTDDEVPAGGGETLDALDPALYRPYLR